MHYRNDSQLEYISNFEKISNEDASLILTEYLYRNNITVSKLKEDKEKLYEICNILKNKYKVTYRDLEKITKISREKIRRMLTKT